MQPDLIAPLIHAIQTRAWYPAVSIFVMLAIALWKRIQPEVWDKIPSRWQWVVAGSVSAAGAFVDAETHSLSWTQALSLAIYALIAIALPAIGLHHTQKQMRAKSDP